jgi:plasmid stabilization system protein ParE
MSSSPSSSSDASYAIEMVERVQRMAEREVERWEARGQGRSQLEEELAAASEQLARHPYAGSRVSPRSKRYRLLLARTQFVIFYTIDEANRIVNLVEMIHGRHRRGRRGRR